MKQNKPKLIPVKAPWMISPSVPYLCLQTDKNDIPLSATFIAYFECNNTLTLAKSMLPQNKVQIVSDPGKFIAAFGKEWAPYHLVRVVFKNGKVGRECFAFSDSERKTQTD